MQCQKQDHKEMYVMKKMQFEFLNNPFICVTCEQLKEQKERTGISNQCKKCHNKRALGYNKKGRTKKRKIISSSSDSFSCRMCNNTFMNSQMSPKRKNSCKPCYNIYRQAQRRVREAVHTSILSEFTCRQCKLKLPIAEKKKYENLCKKCHRTNKK